MLNNEKIGTDFHTIKSILNQQQPPPTAAAAGDFHTIKSILNFIGVQLSNPIVKGFPYY